ncbi:hypothetical protein HDU98_007785 [Podochytrium sp. JEL0797]|nr:hypothetical protein HDU98_007785 [Podochytrium sp. JEL0797]
MKTSSVINALIAGLLIGSTAAQSNSNLVCQVMNTQGVLVNAPCNSASIVESVDAQLKNLLHMGLSADSIISMLKSKLCDHDLICFADLISKAKRDFYCELISSSVASVTSKPATTSSLIKPSTTTTSAAAPAATTVANWATCRLGVDSCKTGYVCCVANADVEKGKATCRMSGPGNDCHVASVSSSPSTSVSSASTKSTVSSKSSSATLVTPIVSSSPASTTSVVPVVSSVSTKLKVSSSTMTVSSKSSTTSVTPVVPSLPTKSTVSTTTVPVSSKSSSTSVSQPLSSPVVKPTTSTTTKPVSTSTSTTPAPAATISNWSACRNGVDTCSDKTFVCCEGKGDTGKTTCRSGAPGSDCKPNVIANYATCRANIDTCSGSGFVCCEATADVPAGKSTCRASTDCATSSHGARMVIYSDDLYPDMLSTKYTHIILDFWTAPGTMNNVDARALQAAGKKVMVSAYGGGINPTTDGRNAVSDAQSLAAYVKASGLDGVDVDWEDSGSLGHGGEAWLIALTQELRKQLPSPRYLISHAPQAPYFDNTGKVYPSGAYLAVDKAVGNLIDFYNVQFYNQGTPSYETCETLLFSDDPNSWVFGTNVFGIAASGIPLNKIVIGKPVTAEGTGGGTGYMSPALLQSCLKQAGAKGWNAGAMGWRYGLDSQGQWAETLTAGMKM